MGPILHSWQHEIGGLKKMWPSKEPGPDSNAIFLPSDPLLLTIYPYVSRLLLICLRVSHRANRLETNTKYEHPAFRSSLTLNSWSREKDFFDGEIRHNPATRDSSQGTSARPEPPSHPASAYRLSGGPRREAARPRRDTHGDEVPVAFHLRHSCVRRPRKLW